MVPLHNRSAMTLHVMHQSIPPAPPAPPPGYCGAFANFTLPGDRAFPNPRAIPELLTLAVSYQNITTQKVSLEKKQTGSSVKDRNNLKRVVKACSRFYACISSLLIKPELHSEIVAIDVNQRFWLLNQISVDII